MFGMCNTPPYRKPASTQVAGAGTPGVGTIGGALANSGFRGRGQLTRPSGMWGWLFPEAPSYRTAPRSAIASEATAPVEELELEEPAASGEAAQCPQVVEAKGPVTVLIRRSE